MSGKVPCEIVTWYLLPAIRREMSSIMVNEYEMQQKDAAKLLGVTNAAVSQYISRKRGNVNFDGIVREEFKKIRREYHKRNPSRKRNLQAM